MAEPFKPFLFLRRSAIWYIRFSGPAPAYRPREKSTGCKPKEESTARKALARFIAKRAVSARLEGDEESGPMTVRRWAGKWLKLGEGRGNDVGIARSRLGLHILPVMGELRLDAVGPEHIDEVMAAVKALGRAPRTQRHVYGQMHAMFEEAVPRLLAANPCQLKRWHLPPKIDADPEWRAGAKFSREEVVMLLTDPRIPPDRRVLYALLFLAGLRFGEASALKWRNYTAELEPLGQLLVAWSFNSRAKKAVANGKRLKLVKTKKTRKVPVHPLLAIILEGWLAGWQDMMGRPPTADDPIVPTNRGTHRNCNGGWRQLNGEPGTKNKQGVRSKGNPGDLGRLGIRRHGAHDTRRTFIGCTLDDGAHKDLLRLVTHGPEGDIMDQYRGEAAWSSLCAEVAKLRLPMLAIMLAKGEKMNVISGIGGRPQRDSKTPAGLLSGGQPIAGSAKPYKNRGPLMPGPASDASAGPQEWPMANMANMALRQALEAIDRGRIDQARALLKRAIESEVDADGAVGK
jgi:integrase